jgi:hypothetical protein
MVKKTRFLMRGDNLCAQAESDWKRVGPQNRTLHGRLPRARKGAYNTCDAFVLAMVGVSIPIPRGSARE